MLPWNSWKLFACCPDQRLVRLEMGGVSPEHELGMEEEAEEEALLRVALEHLDDPVPSATGDAQRCADRERRLMMETPHIGGVRFVDRRGDASRRELDAVDDDLFEPVHRDRLRRVANLGEAPSERDVQQLHATADAENRLASPAGRADESDLEGVPHRIVVAVAGGGILAAVGGGSDVGSAGDDERVQELRVPLGRTLVAFGDCREQDRISAGLNDGSRVVPIDVVRRKLPDPAAKNLARARGDADQRSRAMSLRCCRREPSPRPRS